MAKLVVVTRSTGDYVRGDITKVFEDDQDEGRAVREMDLFRVVRVPGPAKDFIDMEERDYLTYEETLAGAKEPPVRKRRVDLDALEMGEKLKTGKSRLAATDEVAVGARASIDLVKVEK